MILLPDSGGYKDAVLGRMLVKGHHLSEAMEFCYCYCCWLVAACCNGMGMEGINTICVVVAVVVIVVVVNNWLPLSLSCHRRPRCHVVVVVIVLVVVIAVSSSSLSTLSSSTLLLSSMLLRC